MFLFFRFYSALQFALENKDLSSSSPPEDKEKNNTVDCYRVMRKSKGGKKGDESTSLGKNRGLEREHDTENNLNSFH